MILKIILSSLVLIFGAMALLQPRWSTHSLSSPHHASIPSTRLQAIKEKGQTFYNDQTAHYEKFITGDSASQFLDKFSQSCRVKGYQIEMRSQTAHRALAWTNSIEGRRQILVAQKRIDHQWVIFRFEENEKNRYPSPKLDFPAPPWSKLSFSNYSQRCKLKVFSVEAGPHILRKNYRELIQADGWKPLIPDDNFHDAKTLTIDTFTRGQETCHVQYHHQPNQNQPHVTVTLVLERN